MILQSLASYYDRKRECSEPGDRPAPFGFDNVPVRFICVLDEDGVLLHVDVNEGDRKNDIPPQTYTVPESPPRPGSQAYKHPCLLWDNAEFALGLPHAERVKSKAGYAAGVRKKHEHFVRRVETLDCAEDPGVGAVLKFLRRSPAADVAKWAENQPESVRKDVHSALNVGFMLASDTNLVCERPAVVDKINQTIADAAGSDEAQKKACLLTGEHDVPVRIHNAVKGVPGASSTGAAVVSFKPKAFRMNGKDQGENAPIGRRAAHKFWAALKHLLRPGSKQKIQCGGMTMLFWSDVDNDIEGQFGALWDDSNSDPSETDPVRRTERIRAFLNSAKSGARPQRERETIFCILGVSGNRARISTRFWHRGTVAEIAFRVAEHFNDMELVHSQNFPDFRPMTHILRSLATLGDDSNLPPNIPGDWMMAILQGTPYPESLYQAALRRVRTAGGPKGKGKKQWAEIADEHSRISVIKACLNRKAKFRAKRLNSRNEEELTVALDTASKNPGYAMGRLFAVLEKIQLEAAGGPVNATIRDRYYASASNTPAAAFPTLLRLSVHHMKKIGQERPGRRVQFDKLLSNIMANVPSDGLPARLNLEDQGRFAVGYHHQKQDLYTKKEAE